MDEQTMRAVVDEIAAILVGRMFGKIFQLTRASFAVDFRANENLHLFISAEPNEPRLYLIMRKPRALEKSSLNLAPFFQTLRKHLGGAKLREITKDEHERIVRFHFDAIDELDAPYKLTLIAQLTGRAANVFLLDAENRIIDVLRRARETSETTDETTISETNSAHQTLQIGDAYQTPSRPAVNIARQINRQSIQIPQPDSGNQLAPISFALDEHYQTLDAERAFDARATTTLARLRQETIKREKLRRNLENDLLRHGDAETHKRTGDLLLANLSTAKRRGNIVRLIDYFADDAPEIELEVDENLSLQAEAVRRFARYAKAKHAAQEISERLEKTGGELANLETQRAELERIRASRDFDQLSKFIDAEQSSFGRRANAKPQVSQTDARGKTKRKRDEQFKGARRYRSSDGYEILVGRAAKDNDALTFRVARSSDLWLHAADYPGSHVIVRNQARTKEIPHRTIIEAAQLAAQFSQANADAKVSVNYTLKKFVSKPKGAAAGLVRLSSFRTLLVEPKESGERIQ